MGKSRRQLAARDTGNQFGISLTNWTWLRPRVNRYSNKVPRGVILSRVALNFSFIGNVGRWSKLRRAACAPSGRVALEKATVWELRLPRGTACARHISTRGGSPASVRECAMRGISSVALLYLSLARVLLWRLSFSLSAPTANKAAANCLTCGWIGQVLISSGTSALPNNRRSYRGWTCCELLVGGINCRAALVPVIVEARLKLTRARARGLNV